MGFILPALGKDKKADSDSLPQPGTSLPIASDVLRVQNFLLWSENLCPPLNKLKPNLLCDGIGGGILGRCLSHEGGALIDGLSALIK
jgi:hypothetical protein